MSKHHLQFDIGNVYIFDSINTAKQVHSNFLRDNKEGKKYTWSYRNKNVVLTLDGKTKAETAHKYESILNLLEVK
jgi:hypothetical protein